MNPSEALREYLESHLHSALEREDECTCGHENHACVLFFLVDGQVVAAVVPEARALGASELAEALGGAHAERLSTLEPEVALSQPESPHLKSLERLSTARVYLDESLSTQEELVLCPRMFFGREAQCFHVPTREFLDLTHGRVLPLTSAGVTTPDDWAV